VQALSVIGFFQANGVRVNLTLTPSSTFQMQGLAEGRFDIAMTAFDNVVAYREGQARRRSRPTPTCSPSWGGDSGFLSVMGGKGVQRFADLRGKKVSVDAFTATALPFFMKTARSPRRCSWRTCAR